MTEYNFGVYPFKKELYYNFRHSWYSLIPNEMYRYDSQWTLKSELNNRRAKTGLIRLFKKQWVYVTSTVVGYQNTVRMCMGHLFLSHAVYL